MRRMLLLCIVLTSICLADSSTVHADSYYRINLRAYRRMMHQTYPGQFGQRFWNFVDNRVLQPDGPADQVLNSVLKEVLEQLNSADAAGTTVAKVEPTLNADLSATHERTKGILSTLNLPIPDSVVVTQPQTPGADSFSNPVTTPPEFTFPN